VPAQFPASIFAILTAAPGAIPAKAGTLCLPPNLRAVTVPAHSNLGFENTHLPFYQPHISARRVKPADLEPSPPKSFQIADKMASFPSRGTAVPDVNH
jgi:hypothetical protein